ncbi:pancreatic lipase-related protein 2 isoform X2 [Haematobia irritans]|uniref:pancreatic lipase-related protein 2 isoform X2 n=1 Tax=Haematobia irritans TaxID=7368 RepID=UPI003F50CC33
MLSTNIILLLATVLTSPQSGDALNISTLAQKADIYYQQILENGTRLEFPLSMVSSLRSKSNIKVIVHGFTGHRFHYSIKPLGQAYLALGMDNIFLVDWKDAASLDYYSSRKAVGSVGKHLGRMLFKFFRNNEIDPAEVHIIGHSLGAHIAGNIGSYFNGTLGRITGLDPALPLFWPSSSDGLQSNAATFVDVIHTDYPVFGDMTPRGTADFYPNYGYAPQRGCESVNLITANSCSHNRAVILYAESIDLPKNFPSIPCSLSAIRMRSSFMCFMSLSSMGSDISPSVDDLSMEDREIVYMGEYVSKSITGIFYLTTNGAPPFGLGVQLQDG